jgi:AcrR family transcriptional regulator
MTSPSYESILSSGRVAQKERTRREILSAAADLVGEGIVPTVSQAAEKARVGRATAYRYFPTQDSLLLEVGVPLDELQAVLDKTNHLPPSEQIGAIVRATFDWVWTNQAVLRELLRISLEQGRDEGTYERPSHRRRWIAEALGPLGQSMSPEDYHALAGVLTLFIGIEPVIALGDIGRLSRDQAGEALAVAATTLVANWPGVGNPDS